MNSSEERPCREAVRSCRGRVPPRIVQQYSNSAVAAITHRPPWSTSLPSRQKTTTRTVLTTITNRHPFDILKLAVRDAMPLGNFEDSKLTVVLRNLSVGLAETKEGQDVVVKLDMKGEGDAKTTAKVRWQDMVDGKGGEKDGLYEWVCTIPAGRKVVLEAQWDVKGPSDTQWNEEIVHFRAP